MGLNSTPATPAAATASTTASVGGRSHPIWSRPPAGCAGDAKKVYP